MPLLKEWTTEWPLVPDSNRSGGCYTSRYFEGIGRGVAAAADVVEGDADEKDAKSLFMALAFEFGLPSLLMWNMVAGAVVFAEGDAGPQAILFGSPKQK